MKIEKVTPKVCDAVRNALKPAIEKVLAEFGLKLGGPMNARYSDYGFNMKLSIIMEGTEKERATDEHRFSFEEWGLAYGDKVTCSGKEFVVTGFNKTGTKLTMREVATGKQYLAKPQVVKKDGKPLQSKWEKGAGLAEAPPPPRIRMAVHDTQGKKEMAGFGKLTAKPCECKDSEFLCYPEDGACTCGTHQHHVHCAKCRGISQWG